MLLHSTASHNTHKNIYSQGEREIAHKLLHPGDRSRSPIGVIKSPFWGRMKASFHPGRAIPNMGAYQKRHEQHHRRVKRALFGTTQRRRCNTSNHNTNREARTIIIGTAQKQITEGTQNVLDEDVLTHFILGGCDFCVRNLKM